MGTRVMIHGDQVMMLYDRQHAATYLRRMAAVAPEAAFALDAAAALYDQVVAEAESVWLWGHSMGPEVHGPLARPDVRWEIARHVRAAREKEARAVEQVERALAALQG